MNKTQQEEIVEMNNGGDDDDAGAVDGRDGLLCTLLRLKVCGGPCFVLRKKLVRSYLSRNQNYLGITQTEYDGGFRRHGVLTDEEHGRVHTEGLRLRALDRRGATYHMVIAPRRAKARTVIARRRRIMK